MHWFNLTDLLLHHIVYLSTVKYGIVFILLSFFIIDVKPQYSLYNVVVTDKKS